MVACRALGVLPMHASCCDESSPSHLCLPFDLSGNLCCFLLLLEHGVLCVGCVLLWVCCINPPGWRTLARIKHAGNNDDQLLEGRWDRDGSRHSSGGCRPTSCCCSHPAAAAVVVAASSHHSCSMRASAATLVPGNTISWLGVELLGRSSS